MRQLDTTSFFENQLRDEVDTAELLGGWLSSIAPLMFSAKCWTSGGDPAWVSALPGIAQHLYQQSGDAEVLSRVYDAMGNQVAAYLEVADRNTPSMMTTAGHPKQYQTFGDYINLACTHIYAGSTKAGIVNDMHRHSVQSARR